MTLANLKLRIAALLNRDASLFVVGGVDNLLQAVNDARRAAQRDHSFQLAKRDVFLAVSPAGSNWQTACTLTPGGTTTQMKRVDGVWNYVSNPIPSGGVAYLRTSFIDSGVLGDFRRSLPLYDTSQLIVTNDPQWWSRRTFWYLQGNLLKVTNLTATTTYLVEGIQWLPDLADGDPEDMFLTYFPDWLLYASVAALNVYLKDSERFPIDMTVMDRLWQSVKQMDGEVANSGDWTNLD